MHPLGQCRTLHLLWLGSSKKGEVLCITTWYESTTIIQPSFSVSVKGACFCLWIEIARTQQACFIGFGSIMEEPILSAVQWKEWQPTTITMHLLMSMVRSSFHPSSSTVAYAFLFLLSIEVYNTFCVGWERNLKYWCNYTWQADLNMSCVYRRCSAAQVGAFERFACRFEIMWALFGGGRHCSLRNISWTLPGGDFLSQP